MAVICTCYEEFLVIENAIICSSTRLQDIEHNTRLESMIISSSSTILIIIYKSNDSKV